MSDSSNQLAQLIPIPIEEEMRNSYLDYAMSVIVSRAIPDARDGLKPVHRRILYAMYESGCYFDKPFRKSSRIVGEVMGKYHPHGDAAIYDALVRMAQHFSLRLPLIDGQGNFGSMDGDPPAAMRYTEARLAKVAHILLDDIDKETVDFRPNYDGAEEEPEVLPSKFPNLLINGTGGIAVGMATNIPPHNLGEIIDACCMYIDNPDTSFEEYMQVVQGPDFPTGGIILGKGGIKSAIQTGRGSVLIRGRTFTEETKDKKTAIIISEIPFQVNKAKMIERIDELVREKKIEGISELRDESDKSGVRVVIELKKDTFPEVVLNQLYNYTTLQVSFGINMLALNKGRPQIMNLKDVITVFIESREIVITRRTNYLLSKAKERTHILIGLSIAVANIDEVIALIKAAPDPATAKENLMSKKWQAEHVAPLIALIASDKEPLQQLEDSKCYLTEAQAKAILEMRLQRLTGLEQDKITNELQELAKQIAGFLEILGSREILMKVVKEELLEVREQFATPRRTEIQLSEFEYDIEDLIQKEDMVVTVTTGGYIKRVPLSTYRAQRRGGKGRSGITMHEEDMLTELFVVTTHTPLLFFSSTGKVYRLKVYKLPMGTPQAKGRALVNIFPLAPGEVITNLMPLPEDENEWDNLHIMFATAKGNVRRNDLSDFHSIQSNGKIAIRLEEDDRLIDVSVCTDNDHVLLASKEGKCVRFSVTDVRVFKSRTSDGVRGMRVSGDDRVISMSILHGAEEEMSTREAYLKIPVQTRNLIAKEGFPDGLTEQEGVALSKEKIKQMADQEQFILTITENGYGKRTSAYEYRVTNRGGQGIVNIITSERNGKVIASFPVNDNDQIMLISDKGTLIRCPVTDIRITGRNTQGVGIFRTAASEKVVSVARILETFENDGNNHDNEESNLEGENG
jgi:DNA gyrase subunit A